LTALVPIGEHTITLKQTDIRAAGAINTGIRRAPFATRALSDMRRSEIGRACVIRNAEQSRSIEIKTRKSKNRNRIWRAT
jgi:hypothetical protein